MAQPTPPAEKDGKAAKLILIVDDDETLRVLLTQVAVKQGFRAECAEDGSEALEKVKTLSPDLVLLDFMLPALSGFEVVKRLQKGSTRGVPILLMSARPIDPQTLEMFGQEANVRGFVPKPIRTAQLIGELHRVLGTRPPQIGPK